MKNVSSNTNLIIELRYCFDDESKHSMDAEIFNECEKQFIRAIKSTEKYFEDKIQIKIKPREEGSLIDVLTVVVNNHIFGVFVGMFATKFFDSKLPIAKHKTDEISKKLENFQTIKDLIKSGDMTESDFDYIASNDKDLRKHKSNFFKSVKQERDVVKIESTTKADIKVQPVIIVVDRKDFDNFINTKTTEEVEEIQEAKIYIVAPILIKGRRDSWKGILEGISIDFKISDKDFLQLVWNKYINFQNGTFINCELKTIITTNIETEEIKLSREVIRVVNYGEDDTPLKAIMHSRKSRNKKILQGPDLFSGQETNNYNE